MSIKLQLPKLNDLKPRIRVIGVGGAGCNAINNMIDAGLIGVEFVVANTDAQALAASHAEHRLQLGATLTEGLGAGSKPEIGQAAAEEAYEDIRQQIAGSHMVFIAAGMGGGTGTGAAAVIARAAKELGILVVGVVTKPFQFEGVRRQRIAELGITELKKFVDTLIVIPNQNLFRIASDRTTFAEAFVLADQVLYSGVACIVDLIIKEGLINLDFADVRTVMSGMGTAMMGTGEASGESRAILAAEEAISNPLLDDVSLAGARGLLLSITGGTNLTLYEVDEAASRVRQEVDPEANIIVGATFDETLGDRVRVSIVASGMARMGEHPAVQPAYQMSSAPTAPFGQPSPLAPYPASYATPPPQHVQRAADGPVPYYPAPSYPVAGQFAETAPLTHADYSATAPPPLPPAGSWHGQTGVEFADTRPADYAAGYQMSDTGQGYETQPAPERFAPAPPAEVRRGPRRIPDVQEFPAVGQRDYYAKNPGQRPASQSTSPARKPSLFERLTGRGKGGSDSPEKSAAGDNSAAAGGSASRSAANADPRGDEFAWRATDSNQVSEKQELPVFFNKSRR